MLLHDRHEEIWIKMCHFFQVKIPDILNAKTIGEFISVVTGKATETQKTYEEDAKKRFKVNKFETITGSLEQDCTKEYSKN